MTSFSAKENKKDQKKEEIPAKEGLDDNQERERETCAHARTHIQTVFQKELYNF
jgi:hypothetical protein